MTEQETTAKAAEYIQYLCNTIRDDVLDIKTLEAALHAATACEKIGIQLPKELSHNALFGRWITAFDKI